MDLNQRNNALFNQSSYNNSIVLIIFRAIMSQYNNLQNKTILNQDQALIPEVYKKSLESKALMNHYQESQLRKLFSDREKIQQRIREMEDARMQSDRHVFQLEKSKQIKQSTKNQYSREYDKMIEQKRQKEMQQKVKEKWIERKLYNEQNWLRDVHIQKSIEKTKKLQYGKQLQNHLKLQQQMRIRQANKIKQLRQKLKKQAQEASKRQQYQHQMMYKRRKSQNDTAGVKNALDWTAIYQNNRNEAEQQRNQLLTPRMDRMLKLQKQQYYSKGHEVEYKSQNQKRYFQKNNPESIATITREDNQGYNPITNPIPYKYKNPNVLKLLSSFS